MATMVDCTCCCFPSKDGDTDRSAGRRLPLLALLAATNCVTIIVAKFIRSGPKEELFDINHFLLVTECTKFGICVVVETVTTGGGGGLLRSYQSHVFERPMDALKMSVPALAYFVSNACQYIALSHLSAPVFHVSYQSKLVFTALMSVVILSRKYSAVQWACLVLISIGVALVMLGGEDAGNVEGKKSSNQQSVVTGFSAVSVSCLCSALGGVYFEKVLKDAKNRVASGGHSPDAPPPPQVSMWMRNMQLSFFSVVIASALGWHQEMSRPTHKLYLHGFTFWVWVDVGLVAGGGLLVAVVIMYADNVLRGIATSVSVLLSTSVSVVLFGTQVRSLFVVGAVLLLLGIYYYSNALPCGLSSVASGPYFAATLNGRGGGNPTLWLVGCMSVSAVLLSFRMGNNMAIVFAQPFRNVSSLFMTAPLAHAPAPPWSPRLVDASVPLPTPSGANASGTTVQATRIPGLKSVSTPSASVPSVQTKAVSVSAARMSKPPRILISVPPRVAETLRRNTECPGRDQGRAANKTGWGVSLPGDSQPQDFELHFHVVTHGLNEECGGCVALRTLAETLGVFGFSTTSQHFGCPTFRGNVTRRLVIVYPELWKSRCPVDDTFSLHVHWMLAPLGVLGQRAVVRGWWRQDDLVFHYSTEAMNSTAMPVEESNLLTVVRNPRAGDDTDPDVLSTVLAANRSGVAVIIRKGEKFHKGLRPFPHTSPTMRQRFGRAEVVDGRLAERGHNGIIARLQLFEYFLSYDPYSFWSFKAAMVGTVSIVWPMTTHTKEEWVRSIYIGPFLVEKKLPLVVPGVAYGWAPEEIKHARDTMHELRPLLLMFNEWAANTTVGRFARDCDRWHRGETRQLEGGVLARCFYPDQFEAVQAQ